MMLDGRRMMLPTEEIGMRACLEGSAQNLFKHVVNTLSVIHSAMLHVVHGFLIPCSLGDIFSLGIMHSIVSLKRMTQRWLFVMHVLGVAGVDYRYSVTINCVSKVPLVSIGHVVFFPSHHGHYAYSQSYRTYGGTF